MIVIIDYGLGNVGSIHNMLKRADIPSIISSDFEEISSASHLILPGVGSFDTGMVNLEKHGLIEILNHEVLLMRKPILGLCLGAQLMLDSSAEGEHSGLGWIKGRNMRFESVDGIKIPHMGWNTVDPVCETALFNEMPFSSLRFYFVHSYYFSVNDDSQVSAYTYYGKRFASAFRSANVFGVQFHPEKSHMFGLHLLKNFYRIS